MERGIDVSHWNGKLDFSQVKSDSKNIRFVIGKVSESNYYADDTWVANWQGAGSVGLIRGGYHFWRGAVSGKAQAQFFLKYYRSCELPAILDVEDLQVNAYFNQTQADVYLQNLLDWLSVVEAATGKVPIIYTRKTYFNNFSAGTLFKRFTSYPLWTAHYGVSSQQVWIPTCWTKWQFWQDASSGVVAGVPGSCDMNWWQGDYNSLLTFCGVPVAPSTPVTPPVTPPVVTPTNPNLVTVDLTQRWDFSVVPPNLMRKTEVIALLDSLVAEAKKKLQ